MENRVHANVIVCSGFIRKKNQSFEFELYAWLNMFMY